MPLLKNAGKMLKNSINIIHMKKNIFFLMLSLGILWSCNAGNNQEVNSIDTTATVTNIPSNSNTAAVPVNSNTAAAVGTYKGVLPCADCDGIETVIVLKADGSYTRTITYLGKKENNVLSGSGNWTWVNDFTINLGSSVEGPARYDVTEDKLIQLDMAGNRITGELASQYELKKQ